MNSRDLKRMSGQAGGQDTRSFDITLTVALRQYSRWLLWMVFLLWYGVSATPGPQNELSGPRVILRMRVAQQTATYSCWSGLKPPLALVTQSVSAFASENASNCRPVQLYTTTTSRMNGHGPARSPFWKAW